MAENGNGEKLDVRRWLRLACLTVGLFLQAAMPYWKDTMAAHVQGWLQGIEAACLAIALGFSGYPFKVGQKIDVGAVLTAATGGLSNGDRRDGNP